MCHLYPSVGLFLKIREKSGSEVARISDPENLDNPLIEIPEGGAKPAQIKLKGWERSQDWSRYQKPEIPWRIVTNSIGSSDAVVSEALVEQPLNVNVPKGKAFFPASQDCLIWNARNKAEPPSPMPERQGTQKIFPVAEFPGGGPSLFV